MTRDELRSAVDNIESQSVQVSNCSFEMLRWIEDGPRSVKDLLRDYDLLEASFKANADETIALRKRFEDLWRVKIDLENDVARLKKESDQILDDAIVNIDRKAERIKNLETALAGRTYFHSDAVVEARVSELEAAITKTLNENGHLADGDVCTLIDLKRVMPNWELESV